jgi:hypothetical protein
LVRPARPSRAARGFCPPDRDWLSCCWEHRTGRWTHWWLRRRRVAPVFFVFDSGQARWFHRVSAWVGDFEGVENDGAAARLRLETCGTVSRGRGGNSQAKYPCRARLVRSCGLCGWGRVSTPRKPRLRSCASVCNLHFVRPGLQDCGSFCRHRCCHDRVMCGSSWSRPEARLLCQTRLPLFYGHFVISECRYITQI